MSIRSKDKINQLEKLTKKAVSRKINTVEMTIAEEVETWTTEELISVLENDEMPRHLRKRLEKIGIELLE